MYSVACLRHRGDVEYMHQVHTLCANPIVHIVYTYTFLLLHYGHHFRSILAYALLPWRCCVRLPAKQNWRKLGTCQDLRPGAEAKICGQARRRRRAHLQHLVRLMGPERSGLLGLTQCKIVTSVLLGCPGAQSRREMCCGQAFTAITTARDTCCQASAHE